MLTNLTRAYLLLWPECLPLGCLHVSVLAGDDKGFGVYGISRRREKPDFGPSACHSGVSMYPYWQIMTRDWVFTEFPEEERNPSGKHSGQSHHTFSGQLFTVEISFLKMDKPTRSTMTPDLELQVRPPTLETIEPPLTFQMLQLL